MRNLKKVFRLLTLALVFTVALTAISYAGGNKDGVMNVAAGKAATVFNHVKMIIFIVGGFGLVGIAFQAIFGKVKWTWFAGLAVGLGILAAAGAIVNYATGADMDAGATGQATITDSFGAAGNGQFSGQ